MTLINIDLRNVAGETGRHDQVVFHAPVHREGSAGQTIQTAPVIVDLEGGIGSVDLDPGPVVVEIRSRGWEDTAPKTVMVPEEGPITLTGLLLDAFEWEPVVVSEVRALAQAAEAAAVRAEAGAATVGDAQTVLDARDTAVAAADRAETAAGPSAPENLHAPDITWLDTAQSGHGWTTWIGSVTDDSTTSVMGTQSLKITDGAARLTGLNIDLTRQHIVVVYRVESLEPETEVLLQVSDSNHFQNSLVYGLGAGNDPSPWYRLGEWVVATLPNHSNALGAGTVDESSITAIQFRTFGLGTIHLQAVGVTPATPGVVSFSFDDGYSSVLDAARRVLAPRGIKGTSYTIPGLVGGSGFMSLADNRELHDIHGWDIQAHTQIYYSPGGDNAPLVQEMKDARSWIATNGFGAGEHLAWAGGQSGPDIEQVARALYRSARTVTDTQLETVPPSRPFRMRAHSSIGGVGGTSVETVKGLVDRAKSHGGWLHLVFHRIVEGESTRAEDCSFDDLAEIADYVRSSGLPVQTVSEVLDDKVDAGHTHSEYATTAQVEARTPEIRIVSSPELATSPGVLYVVRED